MNKNLLNNILFFQDNIEPLDENLFKDFIKSIRNLYNFVSKSDMFVQKQETVDKIKQDKNHLEALENINALNLLGVTRDTKHKLLMHLLKDNYSLGEKILNVMIFSIYCIRGKKVKFLKNQQMEIIDFIKNEKEFDKNNTGYTFVRLFLTFDILKEKYFLENKTVGSFDLYHNLNLNNTFVFNNMTNNDFIYYMVKQFTTYRLVKPMSLVRTEVTLQEAVVPYLEQNISQEKKELLVAFLNMIQDKLSLDSENRHFLEKLVLNTKLNNKPQNYKEKKLKI